MQQERLMQNKRKGMKSKGIVRTKYKVYELSKNQKQIQA